jgi:hypothetical protein
VTGFDRHEGLGALSVADLESLARLIRKGVLRCPLGQADLAVAHLGSRHVDAAVLFGHDEAATLAILDAVLSERRLRPTTLVDLVWTGPEIAGASSRDTAVVVRELFASAHHSVLIAGFAFDHGADILAPLHAVMRDHGVEATLYLDIPRAPAGTADLAEYARRAIDRFLIANWPFGAPIPEVRYDPRTVSPDSLVSLHAKCIVIDDERALVTSANFTSRGQERNIEVGVLVHNRGLCGQLARQWRAVGEPQQRQPNLEVPARGPGSDRRR